MSKKQTYLEILKQNKTKNILINKKKQKEVQTPPYNYRSTRGLTQ